MKSQLWPATGTTPMPELCRWRAFPTLAPYFLPHIIDHLVDVYPQLQINLVEEKTHVLIERLLEGKLDAAFLALPVEEDELEYGEIFSEEFFVGVSPRHPWGDKRADYSLSSWPVNDCCCWKTVTVCAARLLTTVQAAASARF